MTTTTAPPPLHTAALPHRQLDQEWRCWCVLVDPDERRRQHRCPATVTSPNEPFCANCVERHVNLQALGVIVTTWRAARL